MTFASPLLLLGLLAVAVPILIHLINRRRATRVSFPAIEFLARSNRRLARRMKLKQVALLALRISVFLLLPLAMARPSFFCAGQAGETDGRLPASVVIVIDDSGSMSRPQGAATLYAEALAVASDEIRDLRSWDQVAIVAASSTPASVIGELTDDRGAAQRALREHAPRFAGSDIRAALAMARDIQQTSRLPIRRTLLVGDGTAAGWPSSPADAPTAGLGTLRVLDLNRGADTNVAVRDIAYERAQSGAAGEYTLEASVRAWGLEDANEVEVTLRVDDERVGTTVAIVGPGEDGVARFTHRFEGEGPFRVEVEAEDGLGPRVDDIRAVPLLPERAVRALIVNGDGRSVSLNDEAFFLERALDVALGDRREIEPIMTSPEELANVDLSTVDVVILANVAALPVPQVEDVTRFVESGGGLLLTVGDNVEPERWNSLLSPLLPKPIRSVKVLAERSDPDAGIKATRISSMDVLHPAFRVFSASGSESVRASLVYRYVLLEPEAESAAEVLASYSDGAPALLERAVGRGRVILWTTSIDDGWTDLPLTTGYVPLIRRTVQYLARRGGGSSDQAEVGRRLVLPVAALRPERVTVTTPAGDRVVVPVDGDDAAFVPREVGFHDVSITVAGEEILVAALGFAANADAAESDTQSVDAELVVAVEAQSAEDARAGGDAQASEGTGVWPLLLFIALVALYAETLVAVRRRLWVRLLSAVRGKRREVAL